MCEVGGGVRLRGVRLGNGERWHTPDGLARDTERLAACDEQPHGGTLLGDRVGEPGTGLVSFGAFAYWMWATGGDARFAINISAATLIITCPCALGLAVPAVVTAASGKLFRKGLLIKSGTALERLATVDTVIFDKTGHVPMAERPVRFNRLLKAFLDE